MIQKILEILKIEIKYITELGKILDKHLKWIDDDNTRHLIEIEGDHIIQIGNVFYNYVTKETERVLITYKDNVDENEICDPIEDVTVINCKSEKDLLLEWAELICDKNPDYITGYNIFGFDF